MEVREVGEAILKRDFWIANFGNFQKIQNSLNPKINIAFSPTTRLFKYPKG